MALRTAEEYKQGLKDGRQVYLAGNRVPDVTEDPYIKVGVETGAFDFLMAHDPELEEIAVTKDPETGEAVSRYFDLPDQPDAVAERFELVSAACRYGARLGRVSLRRRSPAVREGRGQ
jgi:aromatic ring hydroxylase